MKFFPKNLHPSGLIRFQVSTKTFASYSQNSKLSQVVSFLTEGAVYDGDIYTNFTEI